MESVRTIVEEATRAPTHRKQNHGYAFMSTEPSHTPGDVLAPLPAHVPPHVQEALAEAKARLQATYGERLRRVIFYGSRARGDATEESDVDVLVVLEGPIENSYREIKRTTDISIAALERYRLHLSLQHYTEAEYQARRGPFMQTVHEEGIEL